MRPYTVVFYVDADRGVAVFVEEVETPMKNDAFRIAVNQAAERGEVITEQGVPVRGYEIRDGATEVATFAGHGLEAKD
jgi:hypothetical protein